MIGRARSATKAAAAPLPVDSRGRTLPRQADPTQPLLVVEDLRAWFDLDGTTVHAVDGVSFTLEQGQALGIAGEGADAGR